jgi:hypothetical protein
MIFLDSVPLWNVRQWPHWFLCGSSTCCRHSPLYEPIKSALYAHVCVFGGQNVLRHALAQTFYS